MAQRRNLKIDLEGQASGERTSGADRKKLILETAGILFSKHGFPNVSTNDIGNTAGVTGPAVYRHFSTKDQILEAIFEDILQNLIGRSESPSRDGSKNARQFVKAHVRFALDDWQRLRLWDQQGQYLAEAARERTRAHQKAYVDAFADAVVETYGATKPAAVLSVLGVVSMIHAMATRSGKDDLQTESFIVGSALAALKAAAKKGLED